MYTLRILLILSIALSALDAQDLTAYSRKGLILRATPAVSGKRLTIIPFGETVTLVNTEPRGEAIIVDGIKAKFLEVKYKNAQGFVFAGYLSSFPAYKGEAENIEIYLASAFGKPKKIVQKAHEEKSETARYLLTYPNGISNQVIIYYGGIYHHLKFPIKYEIREVFLLLKAAEPILRNAQFQEHEEGKYLLKGPISPKEPGGPSRLLKINRESDSIVVITGFQT